MKVENEVAAMNFSSASQPPAVESETFAAPVAADSRAAVSRLVRDGITAAKAGDLPAARAALLEAVRLDERHETALMWLASICDKPHELLEYLKRVLDINPANGRAQQWANATKSLLAKSLIQQGAASHKEGMPEIAAQYFLQAADYEPANEIIWLWLVAVSSEPEDKLSYLNRILSLNPAHEKALALFHKTKAGIARSLLKKGNLAVVSGDYETAREILRDVMEYHPNLDEAWVLKAHLCDSIDEKISCLERAVELNPENDAAQSALNALRVQPAEEEAAAEEFEQPEFEQPEMSAPQSFAADSPIFEDEQPSAAPEEAPAVMAEAPAATEDFVGARYVAVEDIDEAAVTEELAAAPVAPEAEVNDYFAAAPETFAEEQTAFAPQAKADCPFCQAENDASEFRCGSCGAFVRLGDFERLFANEANDEQRLRDYIETAQVNNVELSAQENFKLGLAYLNLRNVKKAVNYFEQVLRLDIDNEDWNAQITSLLDYVGENMPEMTGSAASRSGKTIMVVDDSPTVRKLIVGKLEKHGHRVVAAVDGMDALSKINEGVPDLILLDVTMPRLDGYQLCKLVKANTKTKHVPVVMISGKDGFFDKVRGRMAGSTAYITKPFGPETLIQTVETYCG